MLDLNETVNVDREICVTGTLLGIAYNIFAAILAPRFNRTTEVESHSARPVTVLKPLCGREPGLFTRLASLWKLRSKQAWPTARRANVEAQTCRQKSCRQ